MIRFGFGSIGTEMSSSFPKLLIVIVVDVKNFYIELEFVASKCNEHLRNCDWS